VKHALKSPCSNRRGNPSRISALFTGPEGQFDGCQHLGYPSRKSIVI
jgi:hypothetical protein